MFSLSLFNVIFVFHSLLGEASSADVWSDGGVAVVDGLDGHFPLDCGDCDGGTEQLKPMHRFFWTSDGY